MGKSRTKFVYAPTEEKLIEALENGTIDAGDFTLMEGKLIYITSAGEQIEVTPNKQIATVEESITDLDEKVDKTKSDLDEKIAKNSEDLTKNVKEINETIANTKREMDEAVEEMRVAWTDYTVREDET